MGDVLCLRLNVPASLRRSALVEELPRALAAFERACPLGSWGLMPESLPDRQFDGYSYTLLAWPRDPAGDLAALAQSLHQSLTGRGFGVEASPSSDAAGNSARAQKYLRVRYGDGFAGAPEFFGASARALLAALASVPGELEGGALLQRQVAHLYAMLRAFGLAETRFGPLLDAFIRYNRSRSETAPEAVEAYLAARKAAAEELLKNPAFSGLFERVFTGPRTPETEAFAREAAKGAAALRAARGELPAALPLELAIWNNFIHIHMLLLGARNELEFTLEHAWCRFLDGR
ncbi:MAG TPA: hypothetical protein VFV50_16285 [Bdellovibrionales bacterium]|nr:hypothetical protein [Bdellovibrionales bacterium]